MKRLLNKSPDLYVAMLNYGTTVLKQGLSPAQLLMGRQLRRKIPVLPSKLHSQKLNLKLADEWQKACQKFHFDRRHHAKPLPQLPRNEQVWLKTPQTYEAVVMQKVNHQSRERERERDETESILYQLQTPSGIQRRNLRQLKNKSPHQPHEMTYHPGATSLLPYTRNKSPHPQPGPHEESDTSLQVQASKGGLGNTKTSLPLTVSSDTSPSSQYTPMESAPRNTYTTRSDREIKPPKKCTL
ncbi:Pol polyprotein [Elysia marginata]|uniref:Pol polyprotein n=1 Tax=Elysia marginata TaxID=1093978 RepID=A0AAV4ID22_9GAST|nr:Pol polyprotein [Elysia marginata]